MKKITLLTLIISLTVALYGQSSVWKVQKGKNTIYIGGTVHILRATDYPLPEEFEQAYKKSEKIIFETDVNALTKSGLQQKIMIEGMYKGEASIKDVLSDSTYKKLSAVCSEMGVPAMVISKLKPALAATTITTLKLQKLGMMYPGVEQYFISKIEKDKKEVGQFESVEEQMNILLTAADGIEEDFMRHSLAQVPNMKEDMNKMLHDWRSGTDGFMLESIDQMLSISDQVYNKLLRDRNQKWLPKINSFLETKEVEFVLVGTLHLHGEEGVLNMLKQSGCKITQL